MWMDEQKKQQSKLKPTAPLAEAQTAVRFLDGHLQVSEQSAVEGYRKGSESVVRQVLAAVCGGARGVATRGFRLINAACSFDSK